GQTMRLVQPTPDEHEAAMPQAAPEAEAAVDAVPLASLADIAQLAEKHRDMAFKVQFKRCVRLVRIEPGRLTVNLTEDAPKTLLNDVTNRLQKWTGRRWMVSLSREDGGKTLAEEESGRREMALADARADPAVAAILEKFPGARILDVRIPDAVEEVPGADALPEPDADDEDDI
ncbi:DNA polymerase III subunit gamma/tau, partial [Nitratireductor sp. GCM10026969]